MSGAETMAKEFAFEDRHFELLRSLASSEVGIQLSDAKRELLYGRLARRLRELKLGGFDEYCELLQAPGSSERVEFVNAITTNVTSFFREPHHFDFLRDEALPALMANRSNNRRLRLWSAAASTGQEPYSIAMTMAEALPAASAWDAKLLATDIDSNAVARGQRGVYRAGELPDLSSLGQRRKWFQPLQTAGSESGDVQMAPALQEMIYFRVLNLMEPWPMQGPIDVIFCRNVVIYFSEETQRRLFARFAEILSPDGYLFIGHSESILHSAHLFETVGRTIYKLRKAG